MNGSFNCKYLLISSGKVIPDLYWIVDDHVEPAASLEHSIKINEGKIDLRHHFEGGKEALVRGLGRSLGRHVLQGDDATVDE